MISDRMLWEHLEDLLKQARRDIGIQLAERPGAWVLAMNILLSNTSEYRSVVKELAAADKPMPQSCRKMAVFIDENTRNVTARFR